MARPRERSFLDRPAARLLAFLVLVLVAASLVYIHRDDLWPGPNDIAVDADDPAAACIGARFSDIDLMADDGTITAAQADLFKQRAEAMCRDTESGG